MPEPEERGDAFTARADRILDAAGALLLRHGFRKVTIEDVARRARIGKGTVYLHWRTKDDLFTALLARESLHMLEEVAATLRKNPGEIAPSRMMRLMYVGTVERPLMLAMALGDTGLLGRLAEGDLKDVGTTATAEFFDILTEYELLRTDVPIAPYTLRSAVAGFFVIDDVAPDAMAETLPPGTELDTETRANALAYVIREAFENPRKARRPVLAAAATALVRSLEELFPHYRAWIYQAEPAGSRLHERKKDRP